MSANVSSPISNSPTTTKVFYQSQRCFESVRPPPPHNMMAIFNNNNNLKSYNKNFNNVKKAPENKNDKVHCDVECSKKKTPEKHMKRIHEKNGLQNNTQRFYDNHNMNLPDIVQAHYIPFVSPCCQRNGVSFKQRYLTNRCDRTNNNRKRSPSWSEEQRYQVDVLMERFLSRCSYVSPTLQPDGLKAGGAWDTLSVQIWDTFLLCQQSPQTYNNKIGLWKHLYTYIRTAFPRHGLFLVGSTMSGFGSDTSDVDMCVLVRPGPVDQRTEAPVFLEQLQNALRHCGCVERPELIWAKVPLLKFRDPTRNIEVDLNCNNSVGIRNTHLLQCYAGLDWRVRPLVLVVKLWARENNINNAKNMTISSYSLTLMVIHFLQCGVQPPLIPCLHGLYPDRFQPHSDIHSMDAHDTTQSFRSDNTQGLGELLLGFLNYYACFDYGVSAISVRLGAKIPADECRAVRAPRNEPHHWKYLCIEEPFDLSNTARSVYDPDVFRRVVSVFVRSCRRLHDTADLFSILSLGPAP